ELLDDPTVVEPLARFLERDRPVLHRVSVQTSVRRRPGTRAGSPRNSVLTVGRAAPIAAGQAVGGGGTSLGAGGAAAGGSTAGGTAGAAYSAASCLWRTKISAPARNTTMPITRRPMAPWRIWRSV